MSQTSETQAHPPGRHDLVELSTKTPIWDRFFTVAPLVLIGTREADGGDDVAPKHMAGPLGWQNYFSFVCTPRHSTYQNIARDGVFAVTFPKPAQWLETSLTASPRCEDGEKPGLNLIDTVRAPKVDCPMVRDGYLYLECELERCVDGFGSNSLIVGSVVAARIDRHYLRATERDDQDVMREAPLLGYVSPGRFAVIQDTRSFPFPEGMKK
ncbi:MAG: flavin reductase family protein [Hyphomicrobiales bacterium]